MIAVIAGCGSNITSLDFALQRLNKKIVLTQDPQVIKAASHVILPGVGTANAAMKKLVAAELIPVIQQLTQPTLGICLGMQLLFSHSAEGNADCLNIIPANVTAWPSQENLIIPHMGWNTLKAIDKTHPLWQDLPESSYVYFVHSYQVPVGDYTISTTDYGNKFSSAVQHKNFYGVQFHPERSGLVGEKILENFLNIKAA